jgi:ABC-type phosphate/phosphonate transport system permease subunit
MTLEPLTLSEFVSVVFWGIVISSPFAFVLGCCFAEYLTRNNLPTPKCCRWAERLFGVRGPEEKTDSKRR